MQGILYKDVEWYDSALIIENIDENAIRDAFEKTVPCFHRIVRVFFLPFVFYPQFFFILFDSSILQKVTQDLQFLNFI